MIHTITLNPALDRTLWIEKIQPDKSNRELSRLVDEELKGIDEIISAAKKIS